MLRHDASRIIQTLLKLATPSQRMEVVKVHAQNCHLLGTTAELLTDTPTYPSPPLLQELQGHWLEFSKTKHGHHLVHHLPSHTKQLLPLCHTDHNTGGPQTQKAIRYAPAEGKTAIAKELESHVYRLATHNFGVVRAY